jgi:hypothetical protein
MDSLKLIFHERDFTLRDAAILKTLKEKYEQYRAQGRDLEALGMGRAAHLVLAAFRGDFQPTQPTDWGTL